MKKLICIILALILCVGALTVAAFAAEATATLTGPDTVRAGDNITVTFKLTGKGIYGVSGTLDFDSKLLELKSADCGIKKDWVLELNGNTVLIDQHSQCTFADILAFHLLEGMSDILANIGRFGKLLEIIPEHSAAESDRDRGESSDRHVEGRLKDLAVDILVKSSREAIEIRPTASRRGRIYLRRIIQRFPP